MKVFPFSHDLSEVVAPSLVVSLSVVPVTPVVSEVDVSISDLTLVLAPISDLASISNLRLFPRMPNFGWIGLGPS